MRHTPFTVEPKTPMMRQYFAAKAEHPGVLLAMRVGDFYEFYGEDAETAARALEITLTARDDGDNRVPMAGVPYHSVEKYLARLVGQGFKVALCDQLEDPKQAKGLVKRGVTRVLTAGTVVEDSLLDSSRNNFLAALCLHDGKLGLAVLDSSTGEFAVTQIEGEEMQQSLLNELARISPSELLVSEETQEFGDLASRGLGSAVSCIESPRADRAKKTLLRQLGASHLEGYGCEDKPSAVIAASMILTYAEKNGLQLGHVDAVATYSVESFMRLDAATRRSLELSQNMSDGSRRYTLLAVLDQTCTSMGARLLRRWIEQPLLDVEAIRRRHDAVGRLAENSAARFDLRESLKGVADIERLVSRCATGKATPKDLAALRNSLERLPDIAASVRPVAQGRLAELGAGLLDPHELLSELQSALNDDPPLSTREGGIIRSGFDPELDRLREIQRSGKKFIAELEAAERAKTGIGNLKVGFNSVFGYYLEVPKSQIAKVPAEYIRKQTTANAERYITADLKEQESHVLGAEEKAIALEAELFLDLMQSATRHSRRLLDTSQALAELDTLGSFAETAVRKAYVRPEIVPEDVLEAETVRHPVVEDAEPGFVPNDILLGSLEPEAGEPQTRTIILTGPNMSGKSTYLRQTALLVLMAQIGAFVPASRTRAGVCDRVFARIGARDEIALGQSTFMVEMIESANILNHATERSLVILDEVGRGTSTFDGMAVAWAMIERLAEIGSKTLFATHYHQLNALADQLPTVRNFRVSVAEVGDQVVWTHKVLPGGTDRSYGVHVAKMAGLPPKVVKRAQEILSELEEGASAPQVRDIGVAKLQLSLFEMETPEVIRELEGLDLNQLTPIQALSLLDEWKSRYAKRP